MNYQKIEKNSIANGKGIRVVLWISGCSLHCKGCHNPETWDFNSGKPFDMAAEKELYKYLSNPYVQGITFSGGHPLEYENLPVVYKIIQNIKEKYPMKDIWLYTGLTLNADDFVIKDTFGKKSLLKNSILANCDVVVDGKYEKELQDLSLPFRGSSNQRIIDVAKTIENRKIVLYSI
ncbi:MAG: anaerobic ribonucleoside-triphosphate reductase activating protein [Bacteroidales bacterium]|nr:anaerobic ribonucleoside-triphosphate reductase activating protein [Bacteroidales bacterium]